MTRSTDLDIIAPDDPIIESKPEEKEEEPKRRFLDDDNDYDIPPFLRDRDNF